MNIEYIIILKAKRGRPAVFLKNHPDAGDNPPETVDTRLVNGILSVAVSKAAAEKPKKIAIQGE